MAGLAGIYNILADQGATFGRTITWKDADGDPVNVAGYTARMQVRSTAADATVVLELSTTDGRITLGGVLGTITLTVPATAMAAVEAGAYAYDLEMVNGSDVTRLLMGSFTVRAEVTR
jgi:hypothetical protein